MSYDGAILRSAGGCYYGHRCCNTTDANIRSGSKSSSSFQFDGYEDFCTNLEYTLLWVRNYKFKLIFYFDFLTDRQFFILTKCVTSYKGPL